MPYVLRREHALILLQNIFYKTHNTKSVLATTSLHLEIKGHHALITVCTSQCRGQSSFTTSSKLSHNSVDKNAENAFVIIVFCYWGFKDVQLYSLLLSVGISSMLNTLSSIQYQCLPVPGIEATCGDKGDCTAGKH